MNNNKSLMLSKKKKRDFIIKNVYGIMSAIIISMVFCIPVFASGGGTGTDALNKAKSLLSQGATVGGGLWAVWGLVQLGIAIKDHNGPGMQGAIWQLVGGAIIIAAGVVINSLNLTMTV